MPHRIEDGFGASRARFDEVCSFMGGEDAMGLTHGEPPWPPFVSFLTGDGPAV